MANADDKYPEILLEMRVEMADLLVAQGVAPDQARVIAQAAAEHIRDRWGGMYIPKGHEFRLAQRDRELGNKWNGANRHELCREYDISEQRFYQILARLRRENIAKRQLEMFGDGII